MGILRGVFLFWSTLHAGCSPSETDVVNRFLEASRAHELETLAATSVLPLPVKVRSWRILDVSPERRRPFDLLRLRRLLDEARGVRQRHDEELRRFREENRVDLEQAPGVGGRRDLPTLQSEWASLLSESRRHRETLTQLRLDVELSRAAAAKSLLGWVSVDELTGQEHFKEVSVVVMTPRGRERRLAITVARYVLQDKKGRVLPSRLVIHRIREETAVPAPSR